jgi:2-keto-4-pentenoate hydratase/2-oxohepta-3-ene-1,7-dioic acid hydratase in catechol pathway
MLHPIAQIIEHTSKYFTLKIGDIIFTGTPEGVGPVSVGDVLEGYIEGEKVLHVKVK